MLILHHVDSEHTISEHIVEQIFRHKIERIIGRKTEQHIEREQWQIFDAFFGHCVQAD